VSRAWLGLLPLVLAGAAVAQGNPAHQNVTAGGPLRPGVYGRIVLKGKQVPPPPVIYPQPVIASSAVLPAGVQPVYLYVPPGQVRKWKQNCAQWKACDEPVLFVRVDQSPSRWGRWRHLREQEVALREQD
jgi:hypothetical protein